MKIIGYMNHLVQSQKVRMHATKCDGDVSLQRNLFKKFWKYKNVVHKVQKYTRHFGKYPKQIFKFIVYKEETPPYKGGKSMLGGEFAPLELLLGEGTYNLLAV